MSEFLNSATSCQLSERRIEPVTRRYRPEAAAIDQLVDVLYQLLMDAPAEPLGADSAPAELACLSARHE